LEGMERCPRKQSGNKKIREEKRRSKGGPGSCGVSRGAAKIPRKRWDKKRALYSRFVRTDQSGERGGNKMGRFGRSAFVPNSAHLSGREVRERRTRIKRERITQEGGEGVPLEEEGQTTKWIGGEKNLRKRENPLATQKLDQNKKRKNLNLNGKRAND